MRLEIEFDISERRKGTATMNVTRSEDPIQNGCDISSSASEITGFRHFPVCNAYVTSRGSRGDMSTYGWMEIFHQDHQPGRSDDWCVHPHGIVPLIPDTPLLSYGPEPRFFHAALFDFGLKSEYSYRTFLVYLTGYKEVRFAAGFEWGFKTDSLGVMIKNLHEMRPGQWNLHVDGLNEAFPQWYFLTTARQQHDQYTRSNQPPPASKLLRSKR
jgi:hypothetical protein